MALITHIFTLILFGVTLTHAFDLTFSPPVCLEEGGQFVPDCGQLENDPLARVAVREVFVGRKVEGMCGWKPGDTTSCEYNSTFNDAILALKYRIKSR